MPEIALHVSVHREIEAIKEAVAVNAVRVCAEWLRERGEPDIADRMEAEMLADDGEVEQ